jgi:uncharacterized membrane protein YeaQ/YmgE (transglycosylase-associated protein family)
MSILLFLVFGLIVGLIARALLPGDQRMGWIATTILGVIGSLLGGFVSQLLFAGRLGEPVAAGWIGSIIGALIVLAIGMKVMGPRLRGV